MSKYIEKVIEDTRRRNPNEDVFLQSVEEVLKTIEPVLIKHPEYEENAILERLVEPERVIVFRVPWCDDNGKIQVNKGYRVQFNSAIGPYKGGLRFAKDVNLGVLKFLGFEQTFKNALTTLPIGGGKGGSDFDPHGKSDMEIMRFCQSYMNELYRYIGPYVDVPAGDIGVSEKEIGYLFGQYKRLKGAYENSVITGKGLSYGGSLIRPEAAGYGVLYYGNEVLKYKNDNIKGKTFVLSGYGNVTWGCAKKINEMGGKVISISGHNGYIYDPDGISGEKVDYLLKLRADKNRDIKMFADKYHVQFVEGKKPWELKADIYIPCACQNEVDLEDAKMMVKNGGQYYFEGANMPASSAALKYLQDNGIIVGPAKAANAGGVAVSALEMSQNNLRLTWTSEEVDQKLQAIMKNIHDTSKKASEEYNLGYDLIKGANIAGFEKVAKAMMAEGVI